MKAMSIWAHLDFLVILYLGRLEILKSLWIYRHKLQSQSICDIALDMSFLG